MKKQTQPLYTMSVASRFVGVSPGTLRRWEDRALLSPVRDGRGRRRLYSWQDIERAQQIRYLVLRRRMPLRAVKLHLRMPPAQGAGQAVVMGSRRSGTPLAPRVALSLAR